MWPDAGTSFTRRLAFTQVDFDRFAALSGDNNPIHVNPAYAARTHFGRTVAHGMLLYAALCALWQRHLPGYRPLAQRLLFPAPTYAGEEALLTCRVTDLQPVAGIVTLEARMARPDGVTTMEGETWLRRPESAGSGEPELPGFASRPELPTALAHKGFTLGQRARMRRAFAEEEVAAYQALIAAPNPRPGQVPPPLLASLFSRLLGTRLPGPGTNWLKQRWRFLGPVSAGQMITAEVAISRLRPEKDLVNLQTTAWTDSHDPVCQGEALVLVKELLPA